MIVGFNDGRKQQFLRIRELLQIYYPLQEDKLRFKSTKELEDALKEKENPVHYAKWQKCLQNIKSNTKGSLRFSVSDFGTILMPSLGSVFLLKREKLDKAVYKRKFRVFISLIGRCYTMFGQDEMIVDNPNDVIVNFAPIIYPTPYSLYKSWFHQIKQAIEKEYLGYEFVPYEILMYTMKEVSMPDVGSWRESGPDVFQSLFAAETIYLYQTNQNPFADPFAASRFS